MANSRPLVSELLRPRQLGDLMLPRWQVDRLQRMIDTDDVMNMLFYGGPGLGKTSAARLIATGLGASSREFNGSSATGVDFVRNPIEPFAKSLSLISDHRKICFVDEADYVSKQAQAALRKVIEDSWKTCRFILAVNDPSKIITALHSRLVSICFDVAPADRPEVKRELLRRFSVLLPQAGIRFDEQRLEKLIGIYYPDLRSIANQVQLEFAYEPESA